MQNQQLNALKTLIKIVEKPVGPKPGFEITDVIKLFFLLGEGAPKGRKSLSKELRLGEGSVRTLLNRLQENGLVKMDRGGCRLTESGASIYRELAKTITKPKPVDAGLFSQGAWNYAILIRGSAVKIRSGLEQRDAAVRAGASGATTLLYRAGRFSLPGVDVDVERTYPSNFWKTLRDLLNPMDGDSIIIVGAGSAKDAERGALTAALQTLLADLPISQKT
jgi:DNA-binding PadR family transcriptional regulator